MGKIKVYVAGPYTGGDVVVNVRGAIGASNELLTLGFAPFCPHLFYFWHLLYPHDYETWLDLDNQFVMCCDALLRIPGDSSGADKEIELAKSLDIPVFYSIESLVKNFMKTLIDENRLHARVSEMALEIDEYYKGQDWYRNTQEPVIVIGVLTGAMFFMADLVRKLSIRMKLDFIRTSTYLGEATTLQKPKILVSPTVCLRDTHILLIDDILDTGKTLKLIREDLEWQYPGSIRTTVLLRKLGKAPNDVTADFVGFDIPDEFVVGYGLDYDGRYRELPYVAVWSGNESKTKNKAASKYN